MNRSKRCAVGSMTWGVRAEAYGLWAPSCVPGPFHKSSPTAAHARWNRGSKRQIDDLKRLVNGVLCFLFGL